MGWFAGISLMAKTPPLWATPLFQFIAMWNHMMHLWFSQKGKKKDNGVEINVGGPRMIQAAIWTLQGWRLLKHSRYITFPHHDCCGLCTYVVENAGAKLWVIMCLKKAKYPILLQELIEMFQTATSPSAEGKYSNADIATVCLKEGDVMYVKLISIFLFSFIFKIPGFKPCVIYHTSDQANSDPLTLLWCYSHELWCTYSHPGLTSRPPDMY